MGMVGSWSFCTCCIGFVVEDGSRRLLGSFGSTRTPRAAVPGMVVVAYSSAGVGRPVE
jgi:hypothetical protein